MNKKQKTLLYRILVAAVLFVPVYLISEDIVHVALPKWALFCLFLIIDFIASLAPFSWHSSATFSILLFTFSILALQDELLIGDTFIASEIIYIQQIFSIIG